MDKGAIKAFAIEARKILMKSAATQAGFYGVTKDGCTDPIQKGAGFEVYRTIAGTENRIYGNDINRRRKLKEAVESQGFDQIIEETAYTWFNRLIAIRFMEVNGYLPTRTRVLSSETGSSTPDLVAQYLDVDLGMSNEEIEKVADCIKDNRYDDAFALLFIKQCNALNELLPKLFEKTDDYMELLLKLSYTSDGVVRMLVDSIPESNFNVEEEGQVEIIGWLYQYYNTELNDQVYDGSMSKSRISKEFLPAATTIYTPDWAIRYMVDNSLGRLWLEGHPVEDLKSEFKYYVSEAEQNSNKELSKIQEEYSTLNLEDIKFIDPCMGSGHILVYAFDVFAKLYEMEGYLLRDIPSLILKNNIWGLDIDKRAAQLTYFSVMMKACQYNRRFLRYKIQPSVYAISESNAIDISQLDRFGNKMEKTISEKALSQLRLLLQTFVDAKEYGSILKIPELDLKLIKDYVEDYDEEGQISFETIGIENIQQQILNIINIAEIMTENYHVVVTNPPYLSNSRFSPKLDAYVKKNYADVKADLSMVVYKAVLESFAKRNYFVAFITTSSWMSLASFEKIRQYNQQNITFSSLVDFGTELFEGKVGHNPIVSWVARKCNIQQKFKSIRLVEYCYARRHEKESEFFNEKNAYIASQKDFEIIPGAPMAYWLSKTMADPFKGKLLGDICEPRMGLTTGNNDKYLRLWHEVAYENIGFGMKREKASESRLKWFPYNKGGDFRKWYGNREYVVNWYNDGYEMQNTLHPDGKRIWAHNFNLEYNFKKHITWNDLTSGSLSFRAFEEGFLFDSAAAVAFVPEKLYLYLLGYLNTNYVNILSKILNPTMHFKLGDFAKLPMISGNEEEIQTLVQECISISKDDWDSFENSWDFKRHPLVRGKGRLTHHFKEWESECTGRFERLKQCEERINVIFNEMLGIQNEVSSLLEDRSIAIRKADRTRDIKSLISYAIGCMFGRYSLSNDGVIEYRKTDVQDKYSIFIPDDDNCIPITDEQYFKDDITERFVEFIRCAFGEEFLEENLEFIALSIDDNTSNYMSTIRSYFMNSFIKDHIKSYQKRPIYWLFDSGKQEGFKCLIYVHRYEKDIVGRIRSDYLRNTQDAIEGALKNVEYIISNSSSALDKASATKKREKYIKQLNETRTYFQALSHVALQRIEIDLDDGVKTNYAKFQGIEIVDENGKKQKIDLLAKI